MFVYNDSHLSLKHKYTSDLSIIIIPDNSKQSVTSLSLLADRTVVCCTEHYIGIAIKTEVLLDTCTLVQHNIGFKSDIRGAFGKFLAWSFISVTDLQTFSCLVSFQRAIFPLCYGTNFIRILSCRYEKYYCKYMYCLYTGKRKISVENKTFYLLKSVQNIYNNS